jgi:hypothetical protein
MDRRTSGAFDLSSITMKETSSTAATPKSSRVRAAVQPCSCAETIA